MTRLDQGYMFDELNHQRWFDFGASKNAPKLKTKKKKRKEKKANLIAYTFLEHRLLD